MKTQFILICIIVSFMNSALFCSQSSEVIETSLQTKNDVTSKKHCLQTLIQLLHDIEFELCVLHLFSLGFDRKLIYREKCIDLAKKTQERIGDLDTFFIDNNIALLNNIDESDKRLLIENCTKIQITIDKIFISLERILRLPINIDEKFNTLMVNLNDIFQSLKNYGIIHLDDQK